MALGRILASCAASLAVAGCAVVAFNMNGADSVPTANSSPTTAYAPPPVQAPIGTVAARPAATSAVRGTPAAHSPALPRSMSAKAPAALTPTTAPATTPSSRPAVVAPAPATKPVTPRRTSAGPARPAPTVRAAGPTHAVARGQSLPLGFGTGSATRVITVTAGSASRTTATLQAWTKVTGGWRKYGSAVTAHVGADGLSRHPSESRSATPIGSFTLTQAFGHNADPGTALPYFRTRPSDWWISQSGRLYNTHQRCSSGCSFTRGDPNEHLYYETPYYNYAVVIDYNTRNAPGGVQAGAGSAFFLHVTDGRATAGCVAIPQSKLVPLVRWLNPSTHPRILIGVS